MEVVAYCNVTVFRRGLFLWLWIEDLLSLLCCCSVSRRRKSVGVGLCVSVFDSALSKGHVALINSESTILYLPAPCVCHLVPTNTMSLHLHLLNSTHLLIVPSVLLLPCPVLPHLHSVIFVCFSLLNLHKTAGLADCISRSYKHNPYTQK